MFDITRISLYYTCLIQPETEDVINPWNVLLIKIYEVSQIV